jgi:hypothetical protein
MRQSALGIVLLSFLAAQAALAQSNDPFRSEAPPPPKPAPHAQAPTPEAVAPSPAPLEPIPSNAILVEAAVPKKINEEESWDKNCLANTLPVISIEKDPNMEFHQFARSKSKFLIERKGAQENILLVT